jgi:hypothetical protein
MQPFRTLFKFIRIPLLTAGLLYGGAVYAQETPAIGAGDTVTGTLSDDASNFNYDVVTPSEGLLFTATSDTFTPTLGLAYASGVGGSISVSYDGDVGNPLFIPPLVEGQDVQLQVTSNSFPAEGDFTLTAVAVEVTPVTVGESVDGTIGADGEPQYFSFEAELGKLVTITAQGGEFDTHLQLFAPGSVRSIAADKDGGVGYDPEIYQAVVTGMGTGYIEVASAFSGESGSFTLSVTVSDPPSFDAETPATVRLGGQRGTGVVTFGGVAGGQSEVTVSSAGGETDGAQIAIFQDGVLLASENHFDAEDGAVFMLSTTSDSPVYIIIVADTTFDEADEGQFTVSLAG